MRLPIGYSDFRQLRREGFAYVDKTGLVVEVVRSTSHVLCFPRPRRFGKTLNLSMLRYWFERTDEARGDLYAGLAVESAGDDVAATFQRHPTVFLTFKDVKHRDWPACRADMAGLIQTEADRLRPVWESAPLTDSERASLTMIVVGTATDTDLYGSLRLLTRALHLATGQMAVLLIDEYDTPIHAGWGGEYYDEVIGFFRNLLSSGLKDNAHLYRGVLTGILRVAKESVFSGLNNVSVYTVLSSPFSTWFGFTEPEVQALCDAAGPGVDVLGLRTWYNGYQMGHTVVYNPWSVLRYLSNPADGFQRLIVESLSFLDAHRRTPEAVYQAFLVGLFIHLDATHIVDSNRESGFGRYDVCVQPRTPGRPGAVLELKSYDATRWSAPDLALDAAMGQLRDRAYATRLRQAGADPVWQWGAVFDGKRVHVRVEAG